MNKHKNILGSNHVNEIDHKDLELLKKFINRTGRIKPRRYTGVTARQQRLIAQAIKRARHLALLSFTN